jgi:SNF2 family DNA or RNA helicase
VYITNIDAVKWLVKQKPIFFKKFSTIIVDEVSAFKHHTSQRSKALNKIKKFFKYRSAMSGTPNSNTICDVWNPALFLDDGARLGTSFYGFRSSVCVPEQVGPRREMVQWKDKDGAEEAVFGLLADITIRHEIDKCTDIPKTHIYTKPYHMPKKQMEAYQQMEANQIALLTPERLSTDQARKRLKDGTLSFNTVTAINAAAVTTKLLQIASGAVYESPNKYHLVDTGRYEMVMDLVQERNHPIVFFLWKHQRDEFVRLAESQGLRYCVLDGDATDKERQEIMQHYQAGFYDVAFCHPKSAAHGLTFTKGNSIIWPSPTYDLEWFTQGNRRQARIGQKQKTEVITVLAENTIESKVYERLMAKNMRMGNLLDLFSIAA